MKKILALLLCAIMVLGLIGCGASAPASDAAPAKDEAAPAKEEAAPAKDEVAAPAGEAADVVSLTVTSWRTDDAEAWGRINAAFHEEYPDIEVTFNGVTATEYDSVLQTKLASGNAEDIMFLRAFGSGRQIYDGDYVLPISEADVPKLADIPAASKNPWSTEDGTVYGVPGSMCFGGFFYNKGIFEKCGIASAPETWEEFLADCKILEDNGYIAIADGIKDSWFVTEYISSTIAPVTTGGSKWHTALMNKEVDWTDPKYVKSLEWIKQMAEYLPDGYEAIGYDDAQMLFLSEAAAIYPSGSFDLGYLSSTNPDIDLGWFFMPVENKGDATSINFGMIMGYGINSALKDDAAKLQAAYTYLNWLCEDKAAAMFDNEVVGQFIPNAAASAGIENPLGAEILNGTDGQDLYQQMPYEKVSDQSPDYTAVLTEAVYNVLINGMAPEDAAKKMVEQQAWYFNK